MSFHDEIVELLAESEECQMELQACAADVRRLIAAQNQISLDRLLSAPKLDPIEPPTVPQWLVDFEDRLTAVERDMKDLWPVVTRLAECVKQMQEFMGRLRSLSIATPRRARPSNRRA